MQRLDDSSGRLLTALFDDIKGPSATESFTASVGCLFDSIGGQHDDITGFQGHLGSRWYDGDIVDSQGDTRGFEVFHFAVRVDEIPLMTRTGVDK